MNGQGDGRFEKSDAAVTNVSEEEKTPEKVPVNVERPPTPEEKEKKSTAIFVSVFVMLRISVQLE